MDLHRSHCGAMHQMGWSSWFAFLCRWNKPPREDTVYCGAWRQASTSAAQWEGKGSPETKTGPLCSPAQLERQKREGKSGALGQAGDHFYYLSAPLELNWTGESGGRRAGRGATSTSSKGEPKSRVNCFAGLVWVSAIGACPLGVGVWLSAALGASRMAG